jgi:hypothetical protein
VQEACHADRRIPEKLGLPRKQPFFSNFETQLQIPTTTGDPPFRRRRRRRLLRLRQCGVAVEAMGVKNLWDILDSCKQKLPLNHLQ